MVDKQYPKKIRVLSQNAKKGQGGVGVIHMIPHRDSDIRTLGKLLLIQQNRIFKNIFQKLTKLIDNISFKK